MPRPPVDETRVRVVTDPDTAEEDAAEVDGPEEVVVVDPLLVATVATKAPGVAVGTPALVDTPDEETGVRPSPQEKAGLAAGRLVLANVATVTETGPPVVPVEVVEDITGAVAEVPAPGLGQEVDGGLVCLPPPLAPA